nr:MAG TPA: hypothetical protein [Bacteriophage sp.]
METFDYLVILYNYFNITFVLVILSFIYDNLSIYLK